MVEVRVSTTVPVRVRVNRDQKPISRDCSLASELVQAGISPSSMVVFTPQVSAAAVRSSVLKLLSVVALRSTNKTPDFNYYNHA